LDLVNLILLDFDFEEKEHVSRDSHIIFDHVIVALLLVLRAHWVLVHLLLLQLLCFALLASSGWEKEASIS